MTRSTGRETRVTCGGRDKEKRRAVCSEFLLFRYSWWMLQAQTNDRSCVQRARERLLDKTALVPVPVPGASARGVYNPFCRYALQFRGWTGQPGRGLGEGFGGVPLNDRHACVRSVLYVLEPSQVRESSNLHKYGNDEQFNKKWVVVGWR